ncbi:16S rRNA (cytosine(1402)-N(4))-methyltransferase RsmH [Blattabacterium cuenoti]|uniref:16S rRNA (cytosine(1402)-N(4))-methyltransferase RsmH n=1 Tax=Blattabacterium cuenoti TaxID=1653831 RepID=UPI00163C74AC|nr:16S rRNA (cytosine(1402)-N(4))-methyltransferase RsmH [Blattabacterium cuenoti]
MKNPYHISVLVKESIEKLITDKNGIYIDATFGGGGHSHAILNRLDQKATLIAMDQDIDAVKRNLIKDKRFHLFHTNFIHIEDILKKKQIEKVSGILVDLGPSYFQITNPKRGFSNQLNCMLDMRMNQESNYSAKHIINEYSKNQLSQLFQKYGEFNNAKEIANKILKKRIKKEIITTFDLKNIFFIKGSSKSKKRFFARLFQSIRIEVNNEINLFQDFLFKSKNIISPGGRMAIISYHSIEDRIAKFFFKNRMFFMKKNDISRFSFKMIHKKVIKPSVPEIKKNPRSRSAKLRVAEKQI